MQSYSISSVPLGWRRSEIAQRPGPGITPSDRPLAPHRGSCRVRHREPLHDVFVFIHEISRLIQPGSAVETSHIHHQRVALPAAPRVACPGAIVLQVRTPVKWNDAHVCAPSPTTGPRRCCLRTISIGNGGTSRTRHAMRMAMPGGIAFVMARGCRSPAGGQPADRAASRRAGPRSRMLRPARYRTPSVLRR